ncbi:MAG TPA: hypothetical protein VJZ76_04970 [Thermoanaerobaculia bacterium]|nr:hypothetical protein [Thermoanaerobaculia bacterium]
MRKLLAVLLFLAGACSQLQDTDELSIARRQIHVVPCGAEPAIAGVASVHDDPRMTYVGDWVIVSVCHLDQLVKQAEAAQQPIALFIDGQDFDNPPAGIDFDRGQITFILGRNARNKHHWHPLLYNPLFDPTISLHVSAGIHNERPLPRAPGANAIVVLQKLYTDWTTLVWVAALLAIVIALLIYARKSDLLRDGPTIQNVQQPYSVARVQMAWWFFMIIVGFSYIWMVTGDNDTITPSLLGLMGISAATAVAAVVISPTEARIGARGKLIDEEIAVLDKAIMQVTKDLDEARTRGDESLLLVLADRPKQLATRRAQLISERDSLAIVPPSKGFWRDLVTDDRGAVALDRFQIVAWTMILGFVFLQSVIWDLSMPDFSATTLALMGISSGTYIGFKIPGRAPSSSP